MNLSAAEGAGGANFLEQFCLLAKSAQNKACSALIQQVTYTKRLHPRCTSFLRFFLIVNLFLSS